MFETFLPGVRHLQNIHPMVIHFPIALLGSAALFYVLAWVFASETFASAGFMILIFGTISAAAAVGTGLYAEGGVMVSFSVRDHLLHHHKYFMLTTLGISIALAIWAFIARPFPKRGRLSFVALFLVLLGIMSVGADYGGRMVYDYNAGGNACSQPIEFTK